MRALAGDESPEVQAFARWAAEFGRWLEQGGWLDPALASLSVGPLPTDTPVEFVGFDRWTPAQAAFIERVAGQGAMLTVIWLRVMKGHFTPTHHFAFEGVAWYWHFVDVVWLGLLHLRLLAVSRKASEQRLAYSG